MENREAVKNAQRILRAVAGYRGAIDGDPGPATLAAAARIEGRRAGPWREWPPLRQAVAAAQLALQAQGFDPGPVDGFYGPSTDAAFAAWQGQALPERRLAGVAAGFAPGRFGHQAEALEIFGQPGNPQCTAGIVYPRWDMVLAWDPSEPVRAIRCHALVAQPAQRVFDRLAYIFTPAEVADLGLHLFGGCFNLRKMRGGSAWSLHAWGAAWDFDPMRNRLQWGADRARLAQADAAPFWDAWEAEGFTSLGRARNYDWMHVQAPGV